MFLDMLGQIVARYISSALSCASCERSEKEFACLCVVAGVSAGVCMLKNVSGVSAGLLGMLGCFRGFFWPVKKCEFPTVMVGVLLLADITKVPRLPSCVSRITFLLLGVNQKLIILH